MERKETLVKRYLPVEVFDMAGLAEWFSAMAAQGLHLVKLSENRAQFRQGLVVISVSEGHDCYCQGTIAVETALKIR